MAHFAPNVEGREPGNLGLGIFALGDEAHAKPLMVNERAFVGAYQCADAMIFRQVKVDERSVTVSDWISDPKRTVLQLDPGAYAPETAPYSDGYGRIITPEKVP